MRRTRAGFTLLEMLVAIAIFASLALMAQQVTNGVTRVNSAVADHDQKLNLMQQTMSFLTHDLTQMMPRPVRGDQGQREPALLAGAGVLASESEGMRFVRGGVVNPLMRLPRSNLLTVGYRIHDGYLERLAWPLTRQQININTLDVTQSVILEALFDPWLSPVQARALLQQRPAKGWEDVDQFLAQPLLADVDERTKKQLKTVLSVDSNYFWLRSDITVNEIELTMNSLIVRMGPQHFSVLWHQTGESE
ncbi:type II secretion system minor pseudopilin GspJ [Escherichia coli]|uniref:type II secretion system minor pseudopilin GspJ n=8 Tax=Enterobacteriaceae TaxID=543 RepID=UPI000B7E52B6|nr:type II secretion system minor pseudopilin GspJ [Escherichia coli]